MTICIIDYGSGNLHSVLKAFQLMAGKHEQVAALVTTARELQEASHIVLPGVGAFGDCVAGLKAQTGMFDALQEAVLTDKKPFLGICVGMQMMLQRGLEHGEHEGLGWIDGEVVALRSERQIAEENCQEPAQAAEPFDRALSERQIATKELKIPHMGWNNLMIKQPHPVLSGIENGEHAYFVHSYYARCQSKSDVLATTDYGEEITACIGAGNMIGTQFHPEKSGQSGLKLIENFITWDGAA